MTVNVARRRSKVRIDTGVGGPPNSAIGEIDQTIFACPSCGRPLAIGVRRCPGCSTRLVMGVQMGRASKFVTVGLIVGVAFGGGLAALLSVARLPAHDAQVAEMAAAAVLARAAEVQAAASALAIASQAIPTTAGSTGSTGSTGTGASNTVPAISASALTQALVLDARLGDSAADLQAALAATKLDVQAVSQLLRNASADSVIGLQLAQNLNAWSGGTAVGGRLSTFYSAVQSTAADGLGASIRNEVAYRRAAAAMIKLLGGLGAIDAQGRDLAASAGINLPAATSPAP